MQSFLRLSAVQAITGLSRSTIYARVGEGKFPKPISLGDRAVGWIENEIADWINEQIPTSRDNSAGGVDK
jgi:prophage regulatory protein